MGRYIGLDPGERRVGVAVSDPTGTIASPHAFIDVRDGRVIEEIRDLCAALGASGVVIGLPIRLDGTEGPAAERAHALGEAVAAAVGVTVEYHDERFTTVTAEAALIEGGVRRSARKERRDQVAAAVMLQGFLDGKRADRQVDDGGQHDGA